MSTINKQAQQLLEPIVSNKKVGQYQQIIINVGDLASLCKPGNFVAINVGGSSSSMILSATGNVDQQAAVINASNSPRRQRPEAWCKAMLAQSMFRLPASGASKRAARAVHGKRCKICCHHGAPKARRACRAWPGSVSMTKPNERG